MSALTFGFSLLPTRDVQAHIRLAQLAEQEGLELIGVQDHPYADSLIDNLVLTATLFAHTRSVTIFPDVANLPLRPPAMLAKTAAALDVVSGGRFELGIGAGGVWHAIAGMGVPPLRPAAANAALAEAVTVLRALWTPSRSPVRFSGEHYTLTGTPAGPLPLHEIGIWFGSQGPRSLRLAGAIADGWAAPIAPYLPYEQWAQANRLIDDGAGEAGRDPRTVRRIAQIVGTITEDRGPRDLARVGDIPVRGTAAQWREVIERLAEEQPFTTFVLWPEQHTAEQIRRFAAEVAAPLRAAHQGAADQGSAQDSGRRTSSPSPA